MDQEESSKNGHGEAILRTPSSSPKEEPNGPDPKTDFRLTNTGRGSPPATLEKSKKKSSNTLKRAKTPRRTPSKSRQRFKSLHLRPLRAN